MASSIQGDVASAIGQQVEQMILQAKKDSEQRVKNELNATRTQLAHMENVIAELNERVKRCALANGAGGQDRSHTVDQEFLTQKIQQLEQKWGAEVKALKQDLHRTILAHNHNSDLMRHHRDALDEARRKLDTQTQPKAEQVDAQIEKVDKMLKAGQAKQRALDALTERLGALEQQVGEMVPNPALPSGFPPMLPGMAGLNPMLAAQTQAAAAAAATAGAGGAGASKSRAKKDGEPPTEEEVRARLLQGAARANAGGADNAGMTFNAEAPVFVPRGAPTAVAAEVSTEPAGGASADEEPDAGETEKAIEGGAEAEEAPAAEATAEAAKEA